MVKKRIVRQMQRVQAQAGRNFTLALLAVVLVACGSAAQPDTVRPVQDATAARATIDAALVEAAERPLAAATGVELTQGPPSVAQGDARPAAPPPDPDATATAYAQQMATDVAATLTAQPTLMPTPDAAATVTAREHTMATDVAATLTAHPTLTPTPDAAATVTAREHTLATDVAATLTAQPSPTATPSRTPDPEAAATVLAQQMATAVAATLTAQPTATPNATATAAALGAEVARSVGATLTAEARSRPADTPTPQPTATFLPPTPAVPTATRAAPPAPPTATPGPAPCARGVAPELAGMYNRATLGCPVNEARVVWASWTPFERGHLIWRRDTNHVYGFFNSGWWVESFDQWDQVSAAPSRGSPPPGLQAPERGAAWIWGTDDRFFNELGWARDKQKGFCALVQDFEAGDGFLLRASTQEFCHEEQLYSHARAGDFGLQALAARADGWSATTR